jgi:hypothetical protein
VDKQHLMCVVHLFFVSFVSFVNCCLSVNPLQSRMEVMNRRASLWQYVIWIVLGTLKKFENFEKRRKISKASKKVKV